MQLTHMNYPRGGRVCGAIGGDETSDHLQATCPECIRLHDEYVEKFVADEMSDEDNE